MISPYDEVLYPSHSFSQTHPDRLATIALLFGMNPAPVQRCRVLELGCGDGSNLIPMAFGLRDSGFVGVDLAARPITAGQSAARELGLKNIELRQANLLDVTPELGAFDYVIAHGLYAWVPAPVRDKLLAICRENLAPNGVAYVSYNTYPGCHLRDMIREMMLFHVRNIAEPKERIRQALALVKFIAHSQVKMDTYRLFLQAEVEQVKEHTQAYLYHDDLAEINEPVYFHQFAEHAARQELQFLGEANYYEMQDHIYTPEVVETLRQLSGDRISREQYLDFLKCRRFRQTLLCHAGIALDPTPSADLVTRFYISSSARPASASPELASRRLERFVGKNDSGMETDYPLAKMAMMILGEAWPLRIPFGDLLDRARVRLGNSRQASSETPEEEAATLSKILLQTYGSGLVQFHVHAPPFATSSGDRPVASALARYQIQRASMITNLLHESVMVEGDLAGHLLRILDGTRDRTQLLQELVPRVNENFAAGTIGRNESGIAPSETAQFAENLDRSLEKLCKLGLLVA